MVSLLLSGTHLVNLFKVNFNHHIRQIYTTDNDEDNDVVVVSALGVCHHI